MSTRNVEWARKTTLSPTVRALAVAGSGYRGEISEPEWIQNVPEVARDLIRESATGPDFTYQSYTFCLSESELRNGSETITGDGGTPIQCALDFEGAEAMELEQVSHAPDYFLGWIVAPKLWQSLRSGNDWYGSGAALEAWCEWLVDNDYE